MGAARPAGAVVRGGVPGPHRLAAHAGTEVTAVSEVSEPGGMSLQEAGRRGGEATKTRYGHDHYVTIGKKGGRTVKQRYGSDFYAEAGRKGGDMVKQKYGPAYYAQVGRKGGNTVKQKYGPDYYRQIGRKGGESARSRGDEGDAEAGGAR